MICTILYVFSYSLSSTLSFERHFDSYVASGNTANLSHRPRPPRCPETACSCNPAAWSPASSSPSSRLALFLVGIQGTVDATGQVKDYSASPRRLAPGGIILLASMIFVGVSAMHSVDFVLGPIAPAAGHHRSDHRCHPHPPPRRWSRPQPQPKPPPPQRKHHHPPPPLLPRSQPCNPRPSPPLPPSYSPPRLQPQRSLQRSRRPPRPPIRSQRSPPSSIHPCAQPWSPLSPPHNTASNPNPHPKASSHLPRPAAPPYPCTMKSWIAARFLLALCRHPPLSPPSSPSPRPPPPQPPQLSSSTPTKPAPRIPDNFIGLSYETNELTTPSFFSPDNASLIEQFRTLSTNGVLRIGGQHLRHRLLEAHPLPCSHHPCPAHGHRRTHLRARLLHHA